MFLGIGANYHRDSGLSCNIRHFRQPLEGPLLGPEQTLLHLLSAFLPKV